jgi:capsular exopolysaccharide synthesis family protein
MQNSAIVPPPAPPATLSTLHFLNLLKILYRWLWLFCLTFLAVFSLAIVYILTATPYYRATTVIQVEQAEQRAFTPDSKDESDDLRQDDILRTIEQNIQSPKYFVELASDPKFTQDPNFYIGMNSGSETPTAGEATEFLQTHTRVLLRRGTRLIDVSVEHAVPAMAQKLALALVQEYISENGQLETNTSSGTEQQLAQDSLGIKQDLQKSEDALATYRDVLLLKDRITDQERIIDALVQRYREKHPTLIQARALLSKLTTEFDVEVQKIRANSPLEAGYWADEAARLNAESTPDRIQTELQLVDSRTNVLEGEVETERTLFNNILKQRSEADVSQKAPPTQVLIQEEPFLPGKPVKPQKVLILLLGAAAGLAVGAGLVFFLNGLDSSFKTPEEAEQVLGLPILGAIPQIALPKRASSRGPANPGENLVLIADPGDIAAESFRSLRASIGLLGKAQDHRSLMFTSALASEGKTFVSCNFSASLAQQGIKTLLMDADLRAPAVHQLFKLACNRGLVDHVTLDVPFEDSIYRDVIPNLDVMPAGNRCPNPAEFLGGSGFLDTLKFALTRYDRVIVDSSPVNLVSDSLLVAPHVQSLALVVRAARTPRRASLQALIMLQRSGIQPVGMIMNALPDWSMQTYFPYTGRYGERAKYYRAYAGSTPGGAGAGRS